MMKPYDCNKQYYCTAHATPSTPEPDKCATVQEFVMLFKHIGYVKD